jgi:hypothetical protein
MRIHQFRRCWENAKYDVKQIYHAFERGQKLRTTSFGRFLKKAKI